MKYKCEECGYQADSTKDEIYAFCHLCAERKGIIEKEMKQEVA